MTSEPAIPTTMQAAYIDELGPAENIRYGELSIPVPGPTDVLVRVSAVAVNPVDTFVRSGGYHTHIPFPFVVGRDLAGTVAATGSGVTGFAVGQPVWCNSLGHGGRQGAAAEFALVSADRLYRLPEGVDPDYAAALAHPGATAHLALVTHGGLCPGQTVFVGGGAGHVGGAAIVMAVRAGARVLASASATDLDYCRSLGADVAVDYRDPDLAQRLHDAAPDGVHLYIDTSGHHDMELATALRAPRGRIIIMAGSRSRLDFTAGSLYSKGGSVVGFAISAATVTELADAACRVNQLLADGALVPRRTESVPLAATADAHRRLETGKARGTRLLLRP